MSAALEKYACDRINVILFSPEYVIKVDEENTSSKSRVCVMYIFNTVKSL